MTGDGVADGFRIPLEQRRTALRAALSMPGRLAVTAINEHGLFMPMPASVPLGHHEGITGYVSALDFVTAAEAPDVIDAWARTRQAGAARAGAHLARDPARAVELQFFDVTEEHGVFLMVVALPDDADLAVDADSNPALRPRVAVVRKNELAVVTEVDTALPVMLGVPVEQLLGVRTLDLLDPQDHERAIASWMSMLSEPGCRRRVRLRHRRGDGSWMWFEVTNHNRLNDPEHCDVLTEMVDISDEMAAQEALRSRERLLARLAETLPVGVVQFDSDRRLLYRNDMLTRLLGAVAADDLDEQLAAVAPAHRPLLAAAVTAVLTDGSDQHLEVTVAAGAPAPDRRLTVTLRALTADDGSVVGGVGCVQDVTDSVQLREELAARATFDALTGCQNRASILSTLQQSLARAHDSGVAVVFVDLDEFKATNDRLGHLAGDQVLVTAAQRVGECLRAQDAVGRLGGDEFLVVCPGVRTRSVAERIGARVAGALRGHLVVEGQPVELRASVGVAWAVGAAIDTDALVANADRAMYEAKRLGDGQPVVHQLKAVSAMPRQRAGRRREESAPGGA